MPVAISGFDFGVGDDGASFTASASHFLDDAQRALGQQLSGGSRGARHLVTRPIVPSSMTRALDFYDGPETPLTPVNLVPLVEADDEW